MDMDIIENFLRLPAVLERTGTSRSQIYKDIFEGLFTPPVPMGPRAVGWPKSEVVAITSARISGQSDEEIRELVIRLESVRRTLIVTPTGDANEWEIQEVLPE